MVSPGEIAREQLGHAHACCSIECSLGERRIARAKEVGSRSSHIPNSRSRPSARDTQAFQAVGGPTQGRLSEDTGTRVADVRARVPAMTSEEALRIRGYLTAQGAKLSPEQLIGKVEEAMARLREAATAVPAARFTDPPAPGEWSANEVMAHVVEADRRFGGAIVRILDGRPPGEPQDVAARDTRPRPLADWWSLLERDRAVLFQRVRSADPMANLQ